MIDLPQDGLQNLISLTGFSNGPLTGCHTRNNKGRSAKRKRRKRTDNAIAVIAKGVVDG